MHSVLDVTVADLRSLVSQLGNQGGLISASVYDTAQVLRFSPPPDPVPALRWLLRQQHADGGWGNLAAPLARHVPTMVSVLVLHEYRALIDSHEAVQAGLDFLAQNAYQWQPPLSEDLPVGVELILPELVCEAEGAGLFIDIRPYEALLELGKYKRRLIQKLKPGAGTPPVFSWEAWGQDADPHLLDETGGMGHSPSATAFWLHFTRKHANLTPQRLRAEQYLANAARATGLDVPGVVPSAWPIARFEQSLALHAVQLAGLLDYSPLYPTLKPQVDDLARAMRPDGLGFSDVFMTDGDDTLAAVAVLKGHGHDVEPSTFAPFEEADHFSGYPGEMQTSPSVTARGVHVLHLFGRDAKHTLPYLMERRNGDGFWPGDKWNTSWLYITYLVVYALHLEPEKHRDTLKEVCNNVIAYQNADGGWGPFGTSNPTETAYAISLLNLMMPELNPAMMRGYQWLLNNYRPFVINEEQCWLNKLEYRPHRIDKAFELSAMLNMALRLNGLE